MTKSIWMSEVEGSCSVTIGIQSPKIEANRMVRDGLCDDVVLGYDSNLKC